MPNPYYWRCTRCGHTAAEHGMTGNASYRAPCERCGCHRFRDRMR